MRPDLDDNGDCECLLIFKQQGFVYTPLPTWKEIIMNTAKKFPYGVSEEGLHRISGFFKPYFVDPKAVAVPQPDEIDFEIRNKPLSFHEIFWKHMRRLNLNGPDVYKRIYMDRKLYSKIIKNGHHPSKQVATLLALALKLTYEETIELMVAAGYHLSPSYDPDIVITYHIKRGVYDVIKINTELHKRKLPLLGMTEEELSGHR